MMTAMSSFAWIVEIADLAIIAFSSSVWLDLHGAPLIAAVALLLVVAAWRFFVSRQPLAPCHPAPLVSLCDRMSSMIAAPFLRTTVIGARGPRAPGRWWLSAADARVGVAAAR